MAFPLQYTLCALYMPSALDICTVWISFLISFLSLYIVKIRLGYAFASMSKSFSFVENETVFVLHGEAHKRR